jgi:DNA-binding GntR family transcriptional regulator
VRAEIEDGSRVPGSRLVQEELCETFQVSRGVLREALRRLAAEGLVEFRFNSGARVRHFSRQRILDLEGARMAIEVEAVRLAATRLATSGRERDLRRMIAAMRQATAEGAVRTYLSLNEDFHDLVMEIAGNPVLGEIARRLYTRTIAMQLTDESETGWMLHSNEEHDAIVSHLLNNDADAAEAAMRAHLARQQEMIKAMPDDAFGEDPD